MAPHEERGVSTRITVASVHRVINTDAPAKRGAPAVKIGWGPERVGAAARAACVAQWLRARLGPEMAIVQTESNTAFYSSTWLPTSNLTSM